MTAPRGGSLSALAARGAAVTLASQVTRIILQLASLAVLARLLAPADYGLVAMAVVFIGIAEIIRDFGLSTAAVQAPILTPAQRDNLFWASTALGSALLVSTLLAAPLIASVYGNAEVEGITRALAVVFVLNAMAAQYRAGLYRDLRFGRLAVVDLTAQFLGLVTGVVLAVVGSGYWALVGQQLVQAGLALALVAISGRWLPAWPRRGVGTRPFFSFGGRLLGGQLIGYAGRNVDTLIIGQRFGSADLGVYNRAFQLLMVPLGQIRQPSTSVALPVLSRLQDDPDRYGAYLLRGQVAFGYTLVPALAVAAGAAAPLVEFFLGDQWSRAAPLMQALAVGALFETLTYVAFWAYVSLGLTAQLLQFSIVSSVLKAVFVLVGSGWGVQGVAVGFALGPVLDWPLSLWWLSRSSKLPLPVRGLVVGVLRCAAVAVAGGAAAWAAVALASGLPAVLQLAAAIAACAMAYALMALALPPVRHDVADVVDTLRRVRPGRRRSS